MIVFQTSAKRFPSHLSRAAILNYRSFYRFCGLLAALYTIVINTSHGWFSINFIFSDSQETYLFKYINFLIIYWAVDIWETWMQVGELLTANGFCNRICRKQCLTKCWPSCLKPSKKAITDGSTQNKDNIRRIRR